MANTGFTVNGVDVSNSGSFVPKSYLMDRYPELATAYKNAGMWTWGYNGQGQLADNTRVNKSSPVQTIAGGTNWNFVTTLGGSGGDIGAGIKTDGTLWTWGNNTRGTLGDGTIASKSSPVQTSSGGTTWKQVSVGAGTAGAIKTDGTLWVWGYNTWGQLGNNTTNPTNSGVSAPAQITGGGTNWKQVAVGSQNMFAIKTDGTLWGWGYNGYGQLGSGNLTNRSAVTQIGALTTWKYLSVSTSNIAAIATDGTLWCWGQNFYGGCGDNTSVSRSSPVQTISGGTNWKTVHVNKGSTYGIKNDGTLWTWGNNSYGQLGDNTIVNKSSPVQTVSGGTNWYRVNASMRTVGAIKTDGTLWLWGENGWGQLGDGTIVNKSSPIQTLAGGTNWKRVSAGYVVYAIRDDSADFGIGTL